MFINGSKNKDKVFKKFEKWMSGKRNAGLEQNEPSP